jgi:hypothetical protein
VACALTGKLKGCLRLVIQSLVWLAAAATVVNNIECIISPAFMPRQACSSVL